jgi:hypothetical protein
MLDVFVVEATFTVAAETPQKAAALVAAKLDELKAMLLAISNIKENMELPTGGMLGAPWDATTGPGWKCHVSLNKSED